MAYKGKLAFELEREYWEKAKPILREQRKLRRENEKIWASRINSDRGNNTYVRDFSREPDATPMRLQILSLLAEYGTMTCAEIRQHITDFSVNHVYAQCRDLHLFKLLDRELHTELTSNLRSLYERKVWHYTINDAGRDFLARHNHQAA